MKKIKFIWSSITHEGTIVSISTFGAHQIINIENVTINDSPAAYLTFNIMVSEVKVGQHGPVQIVSITETTLLTPAKMI